MTITASWLRSTGAGDDVLEVRSPGPVDLTMRVNAAHLRQLADDNALELFGPAQAEVEVALNLYRLAHEPAYAQASEDEARRGLAARRELAERERLAREDGLIT